MAQISNGAIFGWYFLIDKTFSGIFLKYGSFDGIEPIFPKKRGPEDLPGNMAGDVLSSRVGFPPSIQE
jgi:hypothetical protein